MSEILWAIASIAGIIYMLWSFVNWIAEKTADKVVEKLRERQASSPGAEK